MSVVTYRDGIIACDSCISERDFAWAPEKKITRLGSGLVAGFVGDADDREIREILGAIKTVDDLPSRRKLRLIHGSYGALLVFNREEVWGIQTGRMGEIWRALSNERNFAAIGSGLDIAYGAMAAGANAIDAAKIACQFILSCREPVYHMEI